MSLTIQSHKIGSYAQNLMWKSNSRVNKIFTKSQVFRKTPLSLLWRCYMNCIEWSPNCGSILLYRTNKGLL